MFFKNPSKFSSHDSLIADHLEGAKFFLMGKLARLCFFLMKRDKSSSKSVFFWMTNRFFLRCDSWISFKGEHVGQSWPRIPVSSQQKVPTTKKNNFTDWTLVGFCFNQELQDSLDSSTALLVLQQIHTLGLTVTDLRQACEEQIAQDFESCVKEDSFKALGKTQLARILAREDLWVAREEVVLDALFTWITASADRSNSLGLLLQHIDFSSLSMQNLEELSMYSQSLGPNGFELQYSVDEAKQMRLTRWWRDDYHDPRRHCLHFWSPELGAFPEGYRGGQWVAGEWNRFDDDEDEMPGDLATLKTSVNQRVVLQQQESKRQVFCFNRWHLSTPEYPRQHLGGIVGQNLISSYSSVLLVYPLFPPSEIVPRKLCDELLLAPGQFLHCRWETTHTMESFCQTISDDCTRPARRSGCHFPCWAYLSGWFEQFQIADASRWPTGGCIADAWLTICLLF